MDKLFSFFVDCGRMGSLKGLFIATDEELKEIEGVELYFGEVLGKHSEVFFTFNKEEHVEEKKDASPEFIAEAEKYIGRTISGFNPLHYTPEEFDEE